MNDDKSGHRQRLRNKFTDNPSALNETELLEMILFYAIPRKDVKSLATELIVNYGSLSSVLTADTSELCKTKGINEYTATCLKLVGWVGKNYSVGQNLSPLQNIIKDFRTSENTEQAIKPVKVSSKETYGSLFVEEGTITFMNKTQINPEEKNLTGTVRTCLASLYCAKLLKFCLVSHIPGQWRGPDIS